MKNEPLVTVVIPTYNREKLIVRAIQSVLDQTYKNFEIFLIDDGSTDNTKEVCSAFSTDSRFKYFYQENQGQSVARNLGIEKSQGEFIAFLDSDNYWLPDKLEKQVKIISENPDVDILYCSGSRMKEDGTLLEDQADSTEKHSGYIVQQLVRNNFISNNTVLVRKKCFLEMGGFDSELRCAEDYDLWLRFSTRYKFLFVPENVACYAVEGDRLSAAEGKVIAANFKIMERFFSDFPDAVSAATRRQAWSSLYQWRAQSNLGRSKKEVRSDLIKSVQLWPTRISNWKAIVRYLLK